MNQRPFLRNTLVGIAALVAIATIPAALFMVWLRYLAWLWSVLF